MPREGTSSGHRRGAWRAVFWTALAVFVCALAALGYIGYPYYHADQEYQDVATQAFDSAAASSAQDAGDATRLGELSVDWDYLKSVNPDVVAWVYIPGTRVSYPVVQGADNDVYLHRSFSGETGFAARAGSIFMDAANAPDASDANTVLYGHHMRDGSMFACLSNDLTNDGPFNEHRTVFVLTPTMNFRCQTFALVLTNGSDAIVQTSFATPDALAAYVADKENRSVVEPDEGFPDPASVGKLFTLATCDYQESNGRAVLFAQVVDSAAPNTHNGEVIGTEDETALSDAVKEGA